jgi:hypothetical protein
MVTLTEIVGWGIMIIPFTVIVCLPAYLGFRLTRNIKFSALMGVIGFGGGIYLGIVPMAVIALVVLVGSAFAFFYARRYFNGGSI